MPTFPDQCWAPLDLHKFGGRGEGETGGVIYNKGDNWLTFVRFYYLYKGNPQGETVPFMDFKDVGGWPGTC